MSKSTKTVAAKFSKVAPAKKAPAPKAAKAPAKAKTAKKAEPVPTIDASTPNDVLVAAIRGDHGPEARELAEAEVGRRQRVVDADAPAGFESAAPTGTDLETQKGEVEAKVEQAVAASAPAHRTLTPAEPWSIRSVLALVFASGPVTTPEVKDAFGKRQQQAYATLRALADAGCIRIGGTEGRRVWERVAGLSDADAFAKLDAAKPARVIGNGASFGRTLAATIAVLTGARSAGTLVVPDGVTTHVDDVLDFLAVVTMGGSPVSTPAPAPAKAPKAAKPAPAPKASKPAPAKLSVGDAVRVAKSFRADYMDLLGKHQTGLVVSKLDGKFAHVMPAKGGDKSRVNVAHLEHE